MTDLTRFFKTAVCAFLVSIPAAAAFAGDGNQIYILQKNPFGAALGNNLMIDQTDATHSLVSGEFAPGGLSGQAIAPALQDGTGNTGSVSISGHGGQVVFLQSGDANAANVSLSSMLGMAFLQQAGIGNTANLPVDPLGLSGAIQQIGNGNSGDLTVSGAGTSGSLVQKGDNNQFGFTVSGNGTSASYTAIGSNMTTLGATPMGISNGGSVPIPQPQYR